MARRRTAVLISGNGSNLEALIGAAREPGFPAEIVLAVSDTAGAFGLERARRAGVAALTVERRRFADRAGFEAALEEVLHTNTVDLVCLAGFMRILSGGFVRHWQDRLMNIHPSLLPAFPGLHCHARALDAGVQVHGCTVHLVRPALDQGPILVQGLVPVRADDDEASLARTVLRLEHRCYPLALRLWAGGCLRLEGERVVGFGAPAAGRRCRPA